MIPTILTDLSIMVLSILILHLISSSETPLFDRSASSYIILTLQYLSNVSLNMKDIV